MPELFVPKALDLLGPALQISDLRQKQAEFKALQDYRNQANQQNQAQNVQAKFQSILSLAGTQPDQAASLFNSDPNLIQMNKGNPVKFIGKSEGYNQFQVDDSGNVTGINPEGQTKNFGIIGKSKEPTSAGLGDLNAFEAVTGTDPKTRGTPKYKSDYLEWKKEARQNITMATPGAVANIGHQIRTEMRANPFIRDYQEVGQRFQVMEEALKESKTTHNFVAVDQALITLFNKMTDPQSVVRESEYARTSGDIGIINRVKGKVQKILEGGAGLTADEREALTTMGRRFNEVYGRNYDMTVTDYEDLAKANGIDPKQIGIPFKRKDRQGTIPSSPPVGNPPVNGAKQAPDGNWYISDPKRPGKYLQVVP